MNEEPSIDRAGVLRRNLLDIRARIESGDFNGAREALFLGHWAEQLEDSSPLRERVQQAIGHTDAAHAALMRWPPDIPGAQASVEAAITVFE